MTGNSTSTERKTLMSDEEYSKDEAITEPQAAAVSEDAADLQAPDEHTTDPQALDEHATELQDTMPAKWEMPKPVFQQTSGYLPQGYVKQIEEAGTAGPFGAAPATAAATAEEASPIPPSASANIEPQPDLSDELVMEDLAADSPAAAPAKGSSVRIPVIVLGVIGILAFLTVFLLAVWFLFMTEPGAGNNF